MKKIIAACLTATLAAALCACGEATQPPTTIGTTAQTATTPEPDGIPEGCIAIDPAQITVLDRITSPKKPFTWDWLNKQSRPIAHSLVVQKQESYLDRFYRVLYLSWPDFRDELTGPGAEKIQAYYAEKYRVAQADKVINSLFEYDYIVDSASEEYHYAYHVYSVEHLKSCLVVNFFSDWYAGGAHGIEGEYTDIFDLRTGKLLTLNDVVDFEACREQFCQALDEDNGIRERARKLFDENGAQKIKFRLTKEGVELIFDPYEIGAYCDGTQYAMVPYAELGGALRIEV